MNNMMNWFGFMVEFLGGRQANARAGEVRMELASTANQKVAVAGFSGP